MSFFQVLEQKIKGFMVLIEKIWATKKATYTLGCFSLYLLIFIIKLIKRVKHIRLLLY